ELLVKGIEDGFAGVFIRAPYILEAGDQVEILSKYEDKIVAARQGNLLTCAFHPELADNPRFHGLFVEMVEQSKLSLHKPAK
ncbi:MAG TPA: pyridoxal 5'-phosphate synthase glutaminase subunit PdxT, partial [Bacillales bacterium]|nr:pyridoxal 5'-phosphate synthase glutaminase subunit PdxT [Bacillales bacterium]